MKKYFKTQLQITANKWICPPSHGKKQIKINFISFKFKNTRIYYFVFPTDYFCIYLQDVILYHHIIAFVPRIFIFKLPTPHIYWILYNIYESVSICMKVIYRYVHTIYTYIAFILINIYVYIYT